ncbi:MAG: hypothetical protein ACO25K_05385 [Candidatus Fonsibacter ubiquis]
MIKFHTSFPNGGYCNVLMQNLILSIIGEKFNLKPQYNFTSKSPLAEYNLWQDPPGNCELGILSKNFNFYYEGRELHDNWKIVDEFNHDYPPEKLMELNSVDFPIIYCGYGQKKCLLYDQYGETDLLLKTINKNCIEHHNKVFVHVRLGDQEHNTIGLEYYEKCLKNIDSFDGGSISSDSPNNSIVQYLSSTYNLEIFDSKDFREVIDYATKFEYRVVTGGSSGWMIGMLGDNDNVYYVKSAYYWPEELFFNPKWKGY